MNLFDVYPIFDIEIVRGLGCRVYDNHDTEYLDLYGGHAVVSVGHCHPHVVEAIREQSARLMFYSNSVVNPLQARLATRLGETCGYPDYSLFLVNSGAEANENAIKLASFHTGRSHIVALHKAFHGRTSAAVEATDNPAISAPVNKGDHVTFIDIDDIDALDARLRHGDVAAVIIEGIQGVGGIHIPSPDFMRATRELCDRYGTVLILDEIQSGYGRSGRFFAHQYSGIRPDIITVAKGIANGFPMGGVLISPRFTPKYGQLGTTFGGNHLACATALAVLDVINDEHLVDNAARVGQYLIERLRAMPGIKEVRGVGLMIGIEMDYPVKELRRRLIDEAHILTGAASTNIIRLLPPLTLTIAEADEFLDHFSRMIAL